MAEKRLANAKEVIMPESEENVNSNQEEVVSPQEEHNTPEVATAPAEEQKPSASDQEYNWRELRKSRDELQSRVQDLEKMVAPKQEGTEEDLNLAPDDLVEWRHVQKQIKKVEDKLRQYQDVSTEISIESKLKTQFPDFDKVVTKENIEILKRNEPEIAAALIASNDLYSKGVSAYKMLKNLNIYKEDTFEKDRQKAQENLDKPRSLSSVSPQSGNSPLSKANAFAEGLTPDLKKQLYKEMQESRKSF